MDKEAMAKVNEILKANGRRELSMDEAENVVGGSFSFDPATGMCIVNGVPMTAAQFNKTVRNIAMNSCTDIAIGWLHDISGFWDSDMANIAGNETGKEADEIIGVILDHFWRVWADGNNH